MRKKNINSKAKILFLMYLYYQILVLYIIATFILLNTNGMLSIVLKNNSLILFLPSLIPITLSIIGINQITIYTSKDLVKIKSTNISLWFSKNHIKYIIIHKSPTVKVQEKFHFLGLKKELIITTKPKNKFKINVSILTKKEREKLIDSIFKFKIN